MLFQSLMRLSLFGFFVGVTNTAFSADFVKSLEHGGKADIIEVRGDLVVGDERKFIDVVISSATAVVVFHSPGGDLLAGIEIGKAIRLKGFSTLVPETMECSSACALAWLGGRLRYMSDQSRLGFHAAYTKREGQQNVSAAGNALVGAYLNQLGLPASAIVYITNTSPREIQWLSFADAQRYGIDGEPFKLASRSAQVIAGEIHGLFDAANRSNADAMAYLQNKHGDRVEYFGRDLANGDVVRHQGVFFTNWPVRRYVVRPNSIKIDCSSETACTSSRTIDVVLSGPRTTSVGSAIFIFGWAFERKGWKIVSESGRVLKRTDSLSRLGAESQSWTKQQTSSTPRQEPTTGSDRCLVFLGLPICGTEQ